MIQNIVSDIFHLKTTNQRLSKQGSAANSANQLMLCRNGKGNVCSLICFNCQTKRFHINISTELLTLTFWLSIYEHQSESEGWANKLRDNAVKVG